MSRSIDSPLMIPGDILERVLRRPSGPAQFVITLEDGSQYELVPKIDYDQAIRRAVAAERAFQEHIASQLAAIVRSVYERYQSSGYHTFRYWLEFDGAGHLSVALDEFIEATYPAEWAAAWQPYANDTTVLPRDPRPRQEAPTP